MQDATVRQSPERSRKLARILPVIMSGGAGLRLWPLSVESRPKQFHELASKDSMLQATLRRVKGATSVEFLPPVVVASIRHRRLVEEQLRDAAVEPAAIVLEPMGRNTAAVAAIAAELATRSGEPAPLVLLLPADHVIADEAGFQAAVARSVETAKSRIVTFGIRPTEPQTGYGYIQRGRPVAENVFEVVRFAEKPSLETACAYVADGGYEWNAGIFLFAPEVMRRELQAHRPDIADAALRALDAADVKDGVLSLPRDLFAACPSESLDVAVMEPTRLAAVAPCAIGWADLGSWSEIWRLGPRDLQDNLARGATVQSDTARSLIWSDGVPVAVAGLNDTIVVASSNGVLVAPMERAQDVKLLAARIRSVDPRPPSAVRAAARSLSDWMMHAALPTWWERAADRDGGGWHDQLDQEGRPFNTDRRCRVQARQVFVYASAGALGWRGDWPRAAEHGLTYLQRCFRRPDGLYRTKVTNEGEPADDTAMLYDQAFVLFAMAALRRAQPQRAELEPAALELLYAVRDAMGHPAGGFRENSAETPFQSNPHMHLFEAAALWAAVGEDPAWADLAEQLATLCLSRFIDVESGAVREFFDQAWSPASGERGQLIEPGHQFEWAWLLGRWSREQGRPDVRRAAARLFELGVRHGVDRSRGVAINGLRTDFSVVDSVARLWPQTERIKAAVEFARFAESADERTLAYEEVVRAARGLERYFETSVPGLWFDRMLDDGALVGEPAPASSFYHIAGAVAELSAAVSEAR